MPNWAVALSGFVQENRVCCRRCDGGAGWHRSRRASGGKGPASGPRERFLAEPCMGLTRIKVPVALCWRRRYQAHLSWRWTTDLFARQDPPTCSRSTGHSRDQGRARYLPCELALVHPTLSAGPCLTGVQPTRVMRPGRCAAGPAFRPCHTKFCLRKHPIQTRKVLTLHWMWPCISHASRGPCHGHHPL